MTHAEDVPSLFRGIPGTGWAAPTTGDAGWQQASSQPGEALEQGLAAFPDLREIDVALIPKQKTQPLLPLAPLASLGQALTWISWPALQLGSGSKYPLPGSGRHLLSPSPKTALALTVACLRGQFSRHL